MSLQSDKTLLMSVYFDVYDSYHKLHSTVCKRWLNAAISNGFQCFCLFGVLGAWHVAAYRQFPLVHIRWAWCHDIRARRSAGETPHRRRWPQCQGPWPHAQEVWERAAEGEQIITTFIAVPLVSDWFSWWKRRGPEVAHYCGARPSREVLCLHVANTHHTLTGLILPVWIMNTAYILKYWVYFGI